MATKTIELTPAQAKLVDRLGALTELIAPYQEEYEAIKAELSAIAADDKTDVPITLKGNVYGLSYSKPAQQNKCLVEPEEFIKLTGAWDAVTVSVAKAEKALNASQFDLLFEKVMGSRRIGRIKKLLTL